MCFVQTMRRSGKHTICPSCCTLRWYRQSAASRRVSVQQSSRHRLCERMVQAWPPRYNRSPKHLEAYQLLGISQAGMLERRLELVKFERRHSDIGRLPHRAPLPHGFNNLAHDGQRLFSCQREL